MIPSQARRARPALRLGVRTASLHASCLLGAFVAASCGVDERPLALTVGEIESPAGVGSGEPFLSSSGDTVFLSWLEASGAGAHELRFARYVASRWDTPKVIQSGHHFFVNWADFPSVSPGPDGELWAHWLERGAEGGYDYGIRIARSLDGGGTWGEPWTPHDDGTPTEHGFVSAGPVAGMFGHVWLDGRRFAPGPHGEAPTEEMALYFRMADANGPVGPETLLDARVCDCCQTDMAVASAGPVVVYRNRSPAEIRDIYITRFVEGAWTEAGPVHEDGWETGACPVNGPAVAARGDDVAVAWFTAAEGVPRVKVAFSADGGRSFADPTLVDGGNPAGRVDLIMIESGAVLVSWLERTTGEGAEVRVRQVFRDGRAGGSVSVSPASGERASGFPRLIRAADGAVLAAWTDVTELAPRVRVALIDARREGT